MNADNGVVQPKSNSTNIRDLADGSASDRLGRQSREMTKDLKEMGSTAKEAAQEKIGQLGDKVSEYYDQGREKAQRAQLSVEEYITEQPLKSILIAAGVGLLLGRFWMRP